MLTTEEDSFQPDSIDSDEFVKYGVCRARLPAVEIFDAKRWADELSKVNPLNAGAEDGEYAFYRNIVDEVDFPFNVFLDSAIGSTIQKHFGVKNLSSEIRLDDAFCIQYDPQIHDDTTCARHMDPSDITVNLCLEKSTGAVGSDVIFYGTKGLSSHKYDSGNSPRSINEDEKKLNEDTEFEFAVKQIEGYATIHWGCHPHMTTPLKCGKRTNIVLTYCYTDSSRSDVNGRTCYATS